MLEIKNVTKIYTTKGGAETRALDDVSISFGETGLVFLLGKSGSGKSTLLNVSGGLDEPTSGEVIVKGKSSKNFSGSDFDSYRNTFVGFVFQEYNILDEFNVEDNIALALELQGKPKDKEKIHALLEEVELADYAKRKPNTLSGGQKQRIAIARALIKDPQIIMADEPTGALDSNTGKQVFDTLKKLSKTRLVIVVSHDREFAETYGDRIVELKDGKIISDVSKRAVPPEKLGEDMAVLNGDTLTVKSGSALTEGNMEKIREFLSDSEGDVIITRGQKQVALFKKANRIGDDGSAETFTETVSGDVSSRVYSEDESKFIRSRLPLVKAIKIGASGLKLKPLRLFFTILLSFVAFTMFGLFSTLMTYDERKVAANTFAENGGDYIKLGKNYRYRYITPEGKTVESDYNNYFTRFTPADVEKLSGKYGNVFATYEASNSNIEIDNLGTNDDVNPDYYIPYISNFSETSGGAHALRLKYGRYPQTDSEIAISSFTLSSIEKYGLVPIDEKGNRVGSASNTAEEISGEQILDKYISLYMPDIHFFQDNKTDYKTVKVVGVFDCGKVPEKYALINDEDHFESSYDYRLLLDEYGAYLRDSVQLMAIMAPSFREKLPKPVDTVHSSSDFDAVSGGVYMEDDTRALNGIKVFGEDNAYKTYFLGGKTTVADDEIVVPVSALIHQIQNGYGYEMDSLEESINNLESTYEAEHPRPSDDDEEALREWESERNAYITENEVSIRERIKELGLAFNELTNLSNILKGTIGVEEGGVYSTRVPTQQEVDEAIERISEIFSDYNNGGEYTITITKGTGNKKYIYKVAGWYKEGYKDSGIYVSQAIYDSFEVLKADKLQTNYVPHEDAYYNSVYIPYKDEHTVNAFLKIYDICGREKADTQTDEFYIITSSLYYSIESVNDYVSMFSNIFLWVGVGVAVFAALLLFNFISVSISNKRKEIGILRAVGARGIDVFKIFFAESGIIVGICLLLSIIGTVVMCSVLNGVLRSIAGFMVTLFVFGFVSVAMMIALALVVAFISTFLPVYFAARKKPVESIRAL